MDKDTTLKEDDNNDKGDYNENEENILKSKGRNKSGNYLKKGHRNTDNVILYSK